MAVRDRLHSLLASVMLSSGLGAPLQPGLEFAAAGAPSTSLRAAVQDGTKADLVSTPSSRLSPLTIPQLRKLERYAITHGLKDIPLNKTMTDGLGITTPAGAPIRVTQISQEFSGRKKSFSFLPDNKGYLLMTLDAQSAGVYHALPSLQPGKAFGRDPQSGAMRYLPEERARQELLQELQTWASVADTVSVASN